MPRSWIPHVPFESYTPYSRIAIRSSRARSFRCEGIKIRIQPSSFFNVATKMREIWESGDLIVEVDQVQFKVSSHVLCLLSDKLASMIARIKNGGKLFNLELPDKGADAFGYIMNVAHNKPGVLPCDFSCRDVENMADMCERYGLHAFFRWHGGLYGKCLPWMRSTFMRVEVKLKTAWIFGNLDIFVAAWDELMDNLHADARGNVYRESIDLEKLLNISDTALVYSKVLVKLEDEIPPTVKSKLSSAHRFRFD